LDPRQILLGHRPDRLLFPDLLIFRHDSTVACLERVPATPEYTTPVWHSTGRVREGYDAGHTRRASGAAGAVDGGAVRGPRTNRRMEGLVSPQVRKGLIQSRNSERRPQWPKLLW
jgi:hypothetical protein